MEYIEQIQTLITDTLGPYGPLMVVGFLGVFLVLITLPVLLRKEVDPLDRLKSSSPSDTGRGNKKEKGERLRTAGGKDKLEEYANFL